MVLRFSFIPNVPLGIFGIENDFISQDNDLGYSIAFTLIKSPLNLSKRLFTDFFIVSLIENSVNKPHFN